MAIRQVDLKRIIAYSSIAHMNIGVLGIFTQNMYGIIGSLLLMVAHGITSSALFFSVGVIYDRYHSRLLKYYSGLVIVMPIFILGFSIFNAANVSIPGTFNFVGEAVIFLGIGISKS
jgi:NADH:ubiquinone oxidoreductase subunit 4 (subunit M)